MWWPFSRTVCEVVDYVADVMGEPMPPRRQYEMSVGYTATIFNGAPCVQVKIMYPSGRVLADLSMGEAGAEAMIDNLQRALAGARAMAQPVGNDATGEVE